MLKRALSKLENFYYGFLIKNLLKTSRLGHGFVVTGAEAGNNFEHIYDNKPKGSFFIGLIVDRLLLNLRAVQATRKRKDDIKKVLWNEIENNSIKKIKTMILDLASGPSRYTREIMSEFPHLRIESICVDKDSCSVRLGKSLSKKEGLKNIRFIKGDIFNLKKLIKFALNKNQAPNVIIAAGLFIYLNDLEVRKALEEIYKFLPKEGLLILTSYEYLDTKKLMRKTMVTASGAKWVLYYRKPDFWRQILDSIGYRYIHITRDEWLMNNVCVARK